MKYADLLKTEVTGLKERVNYSNPLFRGILRELKNLTGVYLSIDIENATEQAMFFKNVVREKIKLLLKILYNGEDLFFGTELRAETFAPSFNRTGCENGDQSNGKKVKGFRVNGEKVEKVQNTGRKTKGGTKNFK